jgi:hypothetical protein
MCCLNDSFESKMISSHLICGWGEEDGQIYVLSHLLKHASPLFTDELPPMVKDAVNSGKNQSSRSYFYCLFFGVLGRKRVDIHIV